LADLGQLRGVIGAHLVAAILRGGLRGSGLRFGRGDPARRVGLGGRDFSADSAWMRSSSARASERD